MLSYVLCISSVINSFVKGAPGFNSVLDLDLYVFCVDAGKYFVHIVRT